MLKVDASTSKYQEVKINHLGSFEESFEEGNKMNQWKEEIATPFE